MPHTPLEFHAGTGLRTADLQRVIDARAEAGGGRVRIPAGTHLIGTIHLRDGVVLDLEPGARLLGSPDLRDYPADTGGFTDAVGQRRGRALVRAAGVRDCGIVGQGVIDGSGGSFERDLQDRPFLVRFSDCRDVLVSGVRLADSAAWVLHLLGCEGVRVDGVTIRSRVNGNNDGIDIDSCRRVRVSGCDIDTGDDAICLKSTRREPCEHVVVTGCVISSMWGAFKIGTESAGDFRDIVASDLVIRETCGGGIKIISMDGGRIERVRISNVTMDRVSGPIFVRLGARLRSYFAGHEPVAPGILSDVVIREVTGTVWEEGYLLYDRLPRLAGMIVTGLPGHAIRDLRLEHVRLQFPGGFRDMPVAPPPEQPAEYPEFPCFHPLPAWGCYARHVDGLVLRDVDLATRAPDARPALAGEDLRRLDLGSIRCNGEPAAFARHGAGA